MGKLTLGLAANGLNALKNILVEPVKQAIGLNAQYENLNNPIASLISINHENITTAGDVVDNSTKWQMSLESAKETINDLKSAGVELGYSVGDMSNMFKGFYSTAGSSMSLDQAKSAMKAIAAAANVSGVSVDSLKVTLDSLGSGIAQTNTDFGRFVGAMGLSTEAMQKAKEEGKLYELIMEKLSPLSESAAFSANNYSVALSCLSAAIDDIKQGALGSYFENIKSSLVSTTNFLHQYKNEIIRFVDINIKHFQALFEPIKDLAHFLWENLSSALQFIGKCFSSSTKEASAFGVALNLIESASVILVSTIKMLLNAIKLAINNFRFLINTAQLAYHHIARALSFGDNNNYQQAQIKALELQDKALKESIIQGVKGYGEIFNDGLAKIKAIWVEKEEEIQKGEQKHTSALKSKSPAKNNLISTNAQNAVSLEKISYLSYFENEWTIRERQIALLNEGKQKELELEKLRYDRVITNLNLELEKKLKLGQISQDQANRLYEAEYELHSQKMKHIREYDATFEMLKGNINSALNQSINNALSGNFTSFKDTFTDLFVSMQSSITKGFANSITQAFMESEVMESMTKTLSGAFNALTGNNEANGGVLRGLLGSTSTSPIMQGVGEALGGFAIGAGAGGLVSSFLGDEQNSKKATNLALGGGAAGALIGSVVPVIGTVLGGLIGGISGALIGTFSSKKKETTAKGIQIWEQATKESISASEFADIKETKRSFWGIGKKTKQWSEYYNASSIQLDVIKQSLRGFEYILEDIGGGLQSIVVSAGRYENYAQVANSGAKAMIEAFFNAPSNALKSTKIDTNAIYNYWSSHAKRINKEVSIALSESLEGYINAGNSFTSWLYEFKGESANAARFQAELALSQVDRLMESLGVSDINIDNFLGFRQEALKQGFDPQTIENINALGEALMQSADAAKKYEEALKGENKTKLNLIDPFLEKNKKLEEINVQNSSVNEKLQVGMLSTLKQLLRVTQENQQDSQDYQKMLKGRTI